MSKARLMPEDRTVVFDFDGVINPYIKGWLGVTEIPEAPVEGVRELLAKLKAAGFRSVIMSSRALADNGETAIVDYLKRHDLWNFIDAVVTEKIPAMVYIDDRAICFTGKTEGLFEQIVNFNSWTGNL